MDILLTMGLPSIDESLDKLLVAMEAFPKSAILGEDAVAGGVGEVDVRAVRRRVGVREAGDALRQLDQRREVP